jgi:hypothetical protein
MSVYRPGKRFCMYLPSRTRARVTPRATRAARTRSGAALDGRKVEVELLGRVLREDTEAHPVAQRHRPLARLRARARARQVGGAGRAVDENRHPARVSTKLVFQYLSGKQVLLKHFGKQQVGYSRRGAGRTESVPHISLSSVDFPAPFGPTCPG